MRWFAVLKLHYSLRIKGYAIFIRRGSVVFANNCGEMQDVIARVREMIKLVECLRKDFELQISRQIDFLGPLIRQI